MFVSNHYHLISKPPPPSITIPNPQPTAIGSNTTANGHRISLSSPITNRPLQEIMTTITATAECGPLLGCRKTLSQTPSLISVALKPADRVIPPRRATAAAYSSHGIPVFISVATLLQATAVAPPPALLPWSRQHPRRRVLSPLLY
ncbi:hypothetical protein SESBI_26091 [Sesbania bispinosa]|nr:hypothetical protein SESBI_26091 [Sesbania bispinosa]